MSLVFRTDLSKLKTLQDLNNTTRRNDWWTEITWVFFGHKKTLKTSEFLWGKKTFPYKLFLFGRLSNTNEQNICSILFQHHQMSWNKTFLCFVVLFWALQTWYCLLTLHKLSKSWCSAVLFLPTGAPKAAETPAAAPAETKSLFSVSLRKYSNICKQRDAYYKSLQVQQTLTKLMNRFIGLNNSHVYNSNSNT